MLGLTIKKETTIKESLFCLDELLLEAGDWIDIGNPFGETQSYPVTIKSLVFNQNKTEENKKVRVSSEASNSKSQPVKPMSIAERIKLGFKQFQSEHKGYESLLILTSEGDVEFSTDPNFLPPDEAKKIFKAWKEHESAFFIGEDRYPIINWAESQFAARNIQGKGIVVGTKTKTNRYGIMKVDPGTKWEPNIAAYAVTVLNLWLNELI